MDSIAKQLEDGKNPVIIFNSEATTEGITPVEELILQLKRLNDNFEYYLDQTLGNAELPLPWK